MTISVSTNSVTWHGNAATTAFSYSFAIPTAADATLLYTTAAGVQSTIPPSAYTITGIGQPTAGGGPQGGVLTYPIAGLPIPAGSLLTLTRTVPDIQPVSFSNQGGLWPLVVEASDDNIVMMVQQIQNIANRTIVVNQADPPLPLPLPPAAARAGQYMGFDGSGNPIAAQPVNSALVSTPMQPVVNAATTAIGGAILGSPGFFNVRNPAFAGGAVGNGSTDDTAAIQAAITACAVAGGTVFFPPGKYNHTALTLDQSASIAGTMRVSLLGSGPGNTVLNFTGLASAAFSFIGSEAGTGIEGLFSIEKLYWQGPGTAGCNGLDIRQVAHIAVKDCVITTFDYGINLVDVLSSYFKGAIITWNKQGLTATYGGFSDPNAISFYSCEIANNANYGVTLSDPSTVNFFGGAIEGNGLTGSAISRFGVLVSSAAVGGLQGGVGANFFGVYFEANAKDADIWCLEGGAEGPQNVVIVGCSFARISGSAGAYVTNNVRMDLAGVSNAKLVMLGNSFVGFNSYVPNAARPYVAINTGGTVHWDWVDLGNFYSSATEAPVVAGPVTGKAAMASAWVSFVGSTGAILQAFNVSAVTRTGVGAYTLTYGEALAGGNYAMSGNVNGAGFVAPVAVNSQSPTLTTLNAAGAATDYGYVAVHCFGGNNLV